MKKKIILLIIVCSSIYSFAERGPYEMEELLLETDLIAHVKITSHTDSNFSIRIIDVIHNHHTGIKTGDYLKVLNDFFVVCPVSVPRIYAEEKREALAFLSYWKGNWYLTQGEIGFIDKGKVRIQFYEEGFEYNASIADWKSELDIYYEHFRLDETGEVKAKCTKKRTEGKYYGNLVMLQYSSIYSGLNLRLDNDSSLKAIFEAPITEPIEVNSGGSEDAIAPFVEIRPIPLDTIRFIMDDIIVYIQANYPEINHSDIAGRTVYSVLFEKDGTISEVNIFRSIHPKIDEGIKAYYQLHNQWSSPQVYKGKPTRFKDNYVLKFGL